MMILFGDRNSFDRVFRGTEEDWSGLIAQGGSPFVIKPEWVGADGMVQGGQDGEPVPVVPAPAHWAEEGRRRLLDIRYDRLTRLARRADRRFWEVVLPSSDLSRNNPQVLIARIKRLNRARMDVVVSGRAAQ